MRAFFCDSVTEKSLCQENVREDSKRNKSVVNPI